MSMTLNRIGRTASQPDVMHLDNNTNWIIQNWLEGKQRVLKLEWIMHQMETWLNACGVLMWSCISAVKSVTVPLFFFLCKSQICRMPLSINPTALSKNSRLQMTNIKTIPIGTKRDFMRLMMATWCLLPQPTMTHFCQEPPLPADCLIQYHLLLWVFTFLCKPH